MDIRRHEMRTEKMRGSRGEINKLREPSGEGYV